MRCERSLCWGKKQVAKGNKKPAPVAVNKGVSQEKGDAARCSTAFPPIPRLMLLLPTVGRLLRLVVVVM